MTLSPRIDSIHDTLYEEYLTALEDDLQPFEQLVTQIETALQAYRKRQEAAGYERDTKEWFTTNRCVERS